MRPTTRAQAGAPAPGPVEDVPVQGAINNIEQVFEVESMKEKKPRFRITQQQLERLEALYKQNTHPSRQVKQSLANEVGLPLKNITIWFQNKRQTIRRRSARFAENVEPERAPGPSSDDCGPSTRILLGLTPEPAIPAKDSPSATKERPIKERAATPTPTPISAATYAAPGPRLGQVYMQDLWAYLPSSPPTPTLVHSSMDSASPSMLLLEDDVFGPVIASYQGPQDTGKRRPDLEWACARAEKRPRIRTSACRSQWSPDRSSDLSDAGDAGVSRERERQLHSSNGNAHSEGQAFCPDILIPKEYHALFPADMIEGASLLLGLKHTVTGGRN